jgi:hypothetical protein
MLLWISAARDHNVEIQSSKFCATKPRIADADVHVCVVPMDVPSRYDRNMFSPY